MKKQKIIEFTDLLKGEYKKDFPFSLNNLVLMTDSYSTPAYSAKGRNMESIQNENSIFPGNGTKVPISKFITE